MNNTNEQGDKIEIKRGTESNTNIQDSLNKTKGNTVTNSLPGIALIIGVIALLIIAVGGLVLSAIWMLRWTDKEETTKIERAVQATIAAQATITAQSTQAATNSRPTPSQATSVVVTATAISINPQRTSVPRNPPQTYEEARNELVNKQALVVGVRFDTPPYGEDLSWKPEWCKLGANMAGFKPEGFDIDFAREFAARWLGDPKKVVFKCISVSDRTPALLNKEVDLLLAAYTWTSKRCSEVGCSEYYVEDSIRLMIATKNLNQFKLLTGSSYYDLCQKKIAVLNDTHAETVIRADKVARCSKYEDVIVYFDRQKAIDDVELGKVDAYATDGLIIQALAQKKPSIFTVLNGDYGRATSPLTIGTPPGEKGLLELINLTLHSMNKEGWFTYYHDQHFNCQSSIPNIPVPKIASLPSYVTRTTKPLQVPCQKLASPEQITEQIYAVKIGDTLGGIAREQFRDFNLWGCILQKNPEIKNEYQLYVGNIKLPNKSEIENCRKNLPKQTS